MEKDINNDIMVSVVCLAYNHSEYIRDALDGFVSQKTKFKYEVIIHDDASTDGTTDIIREYEKKYPEIIYPIYQTENQYSKNKDLLKDFIKSKIRGKYVAFCEGDDYWCSINKLQRQVDFMESNKEYSGCGHRHYMINCETGKKSVYNNITYDCDVDYKIIMEWNGEQFHTSSYLIKAEYFCYPENFSIRNVGNYPQLVWVSLHGKLFQFAEPMSVYRFLANGSWSKRITSGQMLENRRILVEDSINMLENALKYSDDITNKAIKDAIIMYNIERFSLYGKTYEILKKYRKQLNKFGIKKKLSILICSIAPKLFYKLRYRG